MGQIIYLTSRSAIETREECPAKRFYNYDYPIEGVPTGLSTEEASLPLIDGTWGHTAHARALKGDPVDRIIKDVVKGYKEEVLAHGVRGEVDIDNLIREQSAMLEGLVRAWVKVRMPVILDEYDVVSVEEEWSYQLAPGIVQQLRLDAILRRKEDDLLHILDFKFMKYADEIFALKQEHSLQTSLYVKALSEHANEYVGGIMYEGCIKGTWRKDTARSSPWFDQKVQSTPFCYAYALKSGGMTTYQTAYTNRKGYQKVRTYDEMSMKQWVDWLEGYEPQTLTDQFMFVPPISPTPAEMERTIERVAIEEGEYLRKLGKYLQLVADAQKYGNDSMRTQAQRYLELHVAPQREGACFKYGGDFICPYYGHICNNENANPLEDGGFVPRVSHHEKKEEAA
jgi:hypothetical protein